MTTCCSIKERLFSLQENPARPVFPKGQVGAAQIPRPPRPPRHFDVCVAHDSLLSRSPSFLFLLFLWQSWGWGSTSRGGPCLMGITLGTGTKILTLRLPSDPTLPPHLPSPLLLADCADVEFPLFPLDRASLREERKVPTRLVSGPSTCNVPVLRRVVS